MIGAARNQGSARSGFEALVADRSSLGVDPGWWDDFGDAVRCEGEVPFALMDEVVVEAAQQAAVVDVGRATLAPRDPVMCLGPGGWPFAAGEDTALVPGGECEALVAVEQSPAGAEVEDLRLTRQDDGEEAGVAGQPPGLTDGDRAAGVQDGFPGPLRSLVSSTVTTMVAFATPCWGCPSVGRCSISSHNARPSRLPYGRSSTVVSAGMSAFSSAGVIGAGGGAAG